jgi:hypothetical protein
MLQRLENTLCLHCVMAGCGVLGVYIGCWFACSSDALHVLLRVQCIDMLWLGVVLLHPSAVAVSIFPGPDAQHSFTRAPHWQPQHNPCRCGGMLPFNTVPSSVVPGCSPCYVLHGANFCGLFVPAGSLLRTSCTSAPGSFVALALTQLVH